MQENVLEKHPEADLRVYVGWLPMLPTDARFGVAELMVDDRVRHFWDGDQLLGSYFAKLTGAIHTDFRGKGYNLDLRFADLFERT